METKRKVFVGTAVATGIFAAVIAVFVSHKRKLEARGHVPIGKSWEDRQLDWGEWPGGFSIRP